MCGISTIVRFHEPQNTFIFNSFKERGSLISRCSFRFVLFSLYVENKPSGKVFKAHPSSNVMSLIFAFPPPSNEVAVKFVKHFGYSRLRRLLMLNARFPIEVTFCIYGSSVIYIYRNASSLIVLTLSGIRSDVTFEHPMKACSSIVSNWLGSCILVTLPQYANAAFPIDVTESGIAISCNPSQS